MRYFSVTKGEIRKKNTTALARELGISELEARGMRLSLWDFAAEVSPLDGDLSGFEPIALIRACAWDAGITFYKTLGEGFGTSFIETLVRLEILDRVGERIVVHGWTEQQAAYITKAAFNQTAEQMTFNGGTDETYEERKKRLGRERQQRYRDKQKQQLTGQENLDGTIHVGARPLGNAVTRNVTPVTDVTLERNAHNAGVTLPPARSRQEISRQISTPTSFSHSSQNARRSFSQTQTGQTEGIDRMICDAVNRLRSYGFNLPEKDGRSSVKRWLGWGFSAEVIEQAFCYALDEGARVPLAYTNKVLETWRGLGLYALDDCCAYHDAKTGKLWANTG